MGHVFVSAYLYGLIHFRVKINIFFKKEEKIRSHISYQTETLKLP